MGVIIHNGVNYTRKAYEPKKPALVSWTTGTNDEITAMVNAYYDGKLSLDEIKSVWHLGDTRSVDLAAMEATGVGESHRAQTVEMEILDFDHDTLTTPVGSITKALITVDMKGCLRMYSQYTQDGSSNTENGYINSTNTNEGGWTSCDRRTWCNNVFYNAFPSYFKNLVKPVDKLTSAGRGSSTINTDSDYCFLPSEVEVFGSVTNSYVGEGSQYMLFSNDSSNIYKLPRWGSSSYQVSSFWWNRSPRSDGFAAYCRVSDTGQPSMHNATVLCGIAPACCI